MAEPAPRPEPANALECLGNVGLVGSVALAVVLGLTVVPAFQSMEQPQTTHGPGGALLVAFVYAGLFGAAGIGAALSQVLVVAGRRQHRRIPSPSARRDTR